MKNIKLKSLLKEDESKAKAMWNRLDPDSREDILLRFVKDPKQADAMVTMMWDRLPNAISGNKDFQNDVTYLFSKKSPTYTLTEKEDQKELKETNIKLDDQGYAASYYNVSSDVITTWNNTKIITQDIKGYLAAAHETGGPKLVKEVMNAIIAGVDQSKPLLRQLKGTSPADVDLAETKSTKLTSLVKEGRGTGPISKLVRDKYGDDVLNAVYELEETLLGVGAFKNEMADIADIVFEILDAAYDEGYYDGSKSPSSTNY